MPRRYAPVAQLTLACSAVNIHTKEAVCVLALLH